MIDYVIERTANNRAWPFLGDLHGDPPGSLIAFVRSLSSAEQSYERRFRVGEGDAEVCRRWITRIWPDESLAPVRVVHAPYPSERELRVTVAASALNR